MGEIEVLESDEKFQGNICVVEDDTDVRGLVGDLFTQIGFRTHLLRDGYEFLEFLKSGETYKPDCIICDWYLVPVDPEKPRIDAPAVLRMVEHYLPQTPVIVVTGYFCMPEDIHQVMLHGARAYLTKPFDLQVLRGKVEILVRMRNNIERFNIWSSTARLTIEGANGKAGAGELKQPLADAPSSAPPQEEAPSEASTLSPVPAKPLQEKGPSPEPLPKGESLNPALAWELTPTAIPASEKKIDEDVIREFAVSFEDLVADFENTILELEHLYQDGKLSDFSSAFDLAQSGYRVLHTLKGNAGFLAAIHSQGLIHKMEDVLGLVRASPEHLDPESASKLVDYFLIGEDVLAGICRYMQKHLFEKGYETTPAYGLHQGLCREIEELGKEIQMSGSAVESVAENFDGMF